MSAVVNPEAAPFSLRLNSACGIELGDRIVGPGKVRWQVAEAVIRPMLPVAIVLLQLSWGLALPSVLIMLTEFPLRR